MLSYIHAYHAGNHADILKHLTISLILENLRKKEKPFCVIDTHAGSGLYNLNDERALKTNEAKTGIEKLLGQIDTVKYELNTQNLSKFSVSSENSASSVFSDSSVLSPYFSLIQKYYARSQYPGSPLIENSFLRKGDEQILCELHPTAFEELKTSFFNLKKEAKSEGIDFTEPFIHKRDGYEFFNAITPPKIKRGLAVIDPSFEDKSDFEKSAEVISQVHKKWNSGIIALWYPLIAHRSMEISMMKEMICSAVNSTEQKNPESKTPEPTVLDIQLEVKKKEDMTGLSSLYGSGMFIVNFPYKLDEQMKEIMPILSEILGETSKEWKIETY